MIANNSWKEQPAQRWLAYLVVASSLLMIVSMLFHPDGVQGDGSQSQTMRLVHGSLMLLVGFNAAAVSVFVSKFEQTTWATRTGQVFYGLGVVGVMLGTLVSGFVQSGLSDMSASSSISQSSFEALNAFAAIVNQSLIQCGIFALGVGGLAWGGQLLVGQTNDKSFGAIGSLLSLFLVIGILFGGNIGVGFMTILTAVIVLWHASFALWFLRVK